MATAQNDKPVNNGVNVEALFGAGYQLTMGHALGQAGYWAARETVDVVAERGRIDRVRVLGPCRGANQIEIAQTLVSRIGNAGCRAEGC